MAYWLTMRKGRATRNLISSFWCKCVVIFKQICVSNESANVGSPASNWQFKQWRIMIWLRLQCVRNTSENIGSWHRNKFYFYKRLCPFSICQIMWIHSGGSYCCRKTKQPKRKLCAHHSPLFTVHCLIRFYVHLRFRCIVYKFHFVLYFLVNLSHCQRYCRSLLLLLLTHGFEQAPQRKKNLFKQLKF